MNSDEEGLRFSAKAQPWPFLGLTLGLTWLFWFLAAALGQAVSPWVVTVLHFLGGLMPLAVAVGLTHLKHDRPFQRDYWRRIVDFRRISPGWYAIIFLLFPVKSGLAALIAVLQGGQGIAPEAAARLADQPLLIVPTLIFWLLFGPLPEEPGWRGYALDGLQIRHSALTASLMVGAAWSLWHLPLFLIAGTFQAEHVGFGTLGFWFYMVSLPIEAILYTWVYNNTGRSTLSAILFHFVGNAFGELFALSAQAEVHNFVLSIVAALLVVVIWRPETLTRDGRRRN